MKVLVTGAGGFIGQEIVAELAVENHQVVALNRSSSVFENSPNIEYLRGDITEASSLSKITKLRDLDVIVHAAGLAHQFGTTSREEFEAVNVRGTENVLQIGVECRIRHFILIGSTAVYGTSKTVADGDKHPLAIDEESAPAPATLYAESKLAGEAACRRVCEQNAIPLTIFRLAPVIGENNVGNVARLIETIDRRRFVWIGGGRNLKSLIYKRDVARACATVLAAKRGGTEVFNLAAEPIRMADFVQQIAAELNKKILPAAIPAILPRTAFRLNEQSIKSKKIRRLSETVEKWLANDIYSAEKIARAYNFHPHTSISEAVSRQVKQYRINRG